MSESVYDLPADVEWDGVDPKDWRDLPDPPGDEEDDDEDVLCPEWVKMVLGFDPDAEDWSEFEEQTENAFCPTGPGGGIDPTCSPGKGGASGMAAPATKTKGPKRAVPKRPSSVKKAPAKAAKGSKGSKTVKPAKTSKTPKTSKPEKQTGLGIDDDMKEAEGKVKTLSMVKSKLKKKDSTSERAVFEVTGRYTSIGMISRHLEGEGFEMVSGDAYGGPTVMKNKSGVHVTLMYAGKSLTATFTKKAPAAKDNPWTHEEASKGFDHTKSSAQSDPRSPRAARASEKTLGQIGRAIESSNLAEDQKGIMMDAAKRMVGSMTDDEVRWFSEKCMEVQIYVSPGTISSGGRFSAFWDDKTQKMAVSFHHGGDAQGMAETMLHEAAHSYDHPGESWDSSANGGRGGYKRVTNFSEDPAWVSVWQKELRSADMPPYDPDGYNPVEYSRGPLSNYAAWKPSEGFAEFYRVLRSGNNDPRLSEYLKDRFPESYAYFMNVVLPKIRKESTRYDN